MRRRLSLGLSLAIVLSTPLNRLRRATGSTLVANVASVASLS